jgi:hypothetical protein
MTRGERGNSGLVMPNCWVFGWIWDVFGFLNRFVLRGSFQEVEAEAQLD